MLGPPDADRRRDSADLHRVDPRGGAEARQHPGPARMGEQGQVRGQAALGRFETVEDLEGQLIVGDPDEAVEEIRKFEAIGASTWSSTSGSSSTGSSSRSSCWAARCFRRCGSRPPSRRCRGRRGSRDRGEEGTAMTMSIESVPAAAIRCAARSRCATSRWATTWPAPASGSSPSRAWTSRCGRASSSRARALRMRQDDLHERHRGAREAELGSGARRRRARRPGPAPIAPWSSRTTRCCRGARCSTTSASASRCRRG